MFEADLPRCSPGAKHPTLRVLLPTFGEGRAQVTTQPIAAVRRFFAVRRAWD